MKRVVIAVMFVALCVARPFAQATADVGGQWDLTTYSPLGESTNTVEFRKDGDAIKAFAKGEQGERPYDSMQLDGNKLTLVITIEFQGSPMTITYFGTVSEKTMEGSADFGGLATGTFSAKRKEAAAADTK
jgi:hypothetical protein